MQGAWTPYITLQHACIPSLYRTFIDLISILFYLLSIFSYCGKRQHNAMVQKSILLKKAFFILYIISIMVTTTTLKIQHYALFDV